MSFWEQRQEPAERSVDEQLRDGFRAIRDRHARDTEQHVTASVVERRTRDFLDEMEAILLAGAVATDNKEEER